MLILSFKFKRNTLRNYVQERQMDQKRTAKTLYVGHVPLGQMQLSRGEFLSVVSADVDPPNSYGDLSAVRILDEYAIITIRGEPS